MSVEITSAGSDLVLLKLKRDDLYLLLSYLSHAKFGSDIKSYVLLSPLINELIEAILAYSDEVGLSETNSAVWRRSISLEEAADPACFVRSIQDVLERDLGEREAKEALAQALFPNQLETNASLP